MKPFPSRIYGIRKYFSLFYAALEICNPDDVYFITVGHADKARFAVKNKN